MDSLEIYFSPNPEEGPLYHFLGQKMGIHYLPLAFCSHQHHAIQLRWVATPASRILELVLSRWLVLIRVLQKNRKKKKQRDRQRETKRDRESILSFSTFLFYSGWCPPTLERIALLSPFFQMLIFLSGDTLIDTPG